jgi:hypothetical protein
MTTNAAQLNITATGWRGYFQWLQADQPALYDYVAKRITAEVPAVYSDYSQSLGMGALMACGCDPRGFGALGQDADDTSLSLDELSQLPLSDELSVVSPSDLETVTPDVSSVTPVDLSSVANTGGSDPTTTAAVSNIVTAGIQALSASDLQSTALQQANLSQEIRAAAASTPLNLSTASSGILSSLGSSSSTLIIAGGAFLLLIALAMSSSN